MQAVFGNCESKKHRLGNICKYFPSSISINKSRRCWRNSWQKITKTKSITRKDAGFMSVTGKRFYVECMLNLAVRLRSTWLGTEIGDK